LQGFRMKNPNAEFVPIARSLIPFVGNATIGWVALLAGQVALGGNLFGLLRRYGEKSCPVRKWLKCCGKSAAGRNP